MKKIILLSTAVLISNFIFCQIPHSTLKDTIGFDKDLKIIESKLGILEKDIKDNLIPLKVEYFSFKDSTFSKVDRENLYSGILIIHNSIKEDLIGIFEELKRDTFPIAKIIPINKYGLNEDSTGWSDTKSMEDNNTSVFNYRRTTSSKKLSTHGRGISIDINPLFNPYEQYEPDGKFVEPEGGVYKKNRLGTIDENTIVKYFEKRGWVWGGRWGNPIDYQHFQKTSGRGKKHYLIKHNSIKNFFRINESNGDISMFSGKDTKMSNSPECVIYKNERQLFLNLIENLNEESLLNIYSAKGKKSFSDYSKWAKGLELKDKQNRIISFTRAIEQKRPVFSKLRIAIDPGHFADSYQTALMEQKFIVDESGKIQTFEAKHTYSIAKILQDKLSELGIETLITHEYGKSSTGEAISTHLKNEGISLNSFENYENYLKIKDNSQYKKALRGFKGKDNWERSKKINRFNPHLTIIIHLNTSNQFSFDANLSNSSENFNMVFVPGAFMENELKYPFDRLQFLRFLISENLSNSTKLAEIVLDNLKTETGINPVDKNYHSDIEGVNYLERSCIKTDVDGVYNRNLALTRWITSDLVYVEALCQNNKDEIQKLTNKDVKFKLNGKKEFASNRDFEIANALFKSIEQFIELEYEEKLPRIE